MCIAPVLLPLYYEFNPGLLSLFRCICNVACLYAVSAEVYFATVLFVSTDSSIAAVIVFFYDVMLTPTILVFFVDRLFYANFLILPQTQLLLLLLLLRQQ